MLSIRIYGQKSYEFCVLWYFESSPDVIGGLFVDFDLWFCGQYVGGHLWDR